MTILMQLLGRRFGTATTGTGAPSAANSVFERILDAVVAKIQTLNLSGIATDDIKKQKLPWNMRDVQPGVFVCPLPENEIPKMNVQDDIGYAILVATIQKSNHSLTSNLDRHLTWRQAIVRAFRHQALAAVSEVYTVTIEPGPVIDLDAFAKQYDAGSLVLRCLAREPRG